MKTLVIPELREHAPFDELEPAALDYLSRELRLAYYARGELILGPDSGVADRLRIVKQGAVRGSGGPADVLLGPGEAFPLGALVGRRATAYRYRADVDTFCWELEAPRFHELMEKSPRFRAFATHHLAMLVERAHRALLAQVIDALAQFLGDGLPVAFHAPFDAAVLRRHGLRTRAKWLDLATLAPALFPAKGKADSPLEHWLAAFGIAPRARHDALGDAFATAQLLLAALAEARRQRVASVEGLRQAANSRFLRP